MKKQIKKLFVTALRSDEYKQTTQRLRTKDNRFCRLGVLCNLHAQVHPEITAMETNPENYLFSNICGNKRYPHAANHRTNHWSVCTNSNEPGQAGSQYLEVKKQEGT